MAATKGANAPCPCRSGKKFKLCHGAPQPVLTAPAKPLELVRSSSLLRLDLGCGNTPREGFEGVDVAGDKAMHKVDLFKFPWPWADNSVEELHCSHFAEHIPARWVEEGDLSRTKVADDPDEDERRARVERFVGQDFFFAFFDECWRILKPDAWLTVIVPCLRSNRAFQDPTHRRFICEDTFAYLWNEWRKVNVPQYKVRCNFESNIQTTIPNEIGLKSPEVQAELIRFKWNVGQDFVVKMKAVKTPVKPA